MFCIRPHSALDLQQAMFILSYYPVNVVSFSDGEDPDSTYLVVDELPQNSNLAPERAFCPEDELYLAELAFQMNFRQSGIVCPHCKTKNPHEDCCGHLTFTSFIGK